jgi:hypothetical protein
MPLAMLIVFSFGGMGIIGTKIYLSIPRDALVVMQFELITINAEGVG